MAASGLNYEELNRMYDKKEELSKKLDSAMVLWLLHSKKEKISI
jgi:hypothetical protein